MRSKLESLACLLRIVLKLTVLNRSFFIPHGFAYNFFKPYYYSPIHILPCLSTRDFKSKQQQPTRSGVRAAQRLKIVKNRDLCAWF
ncbi:hypothetical protein SUGI_0025450 [Cryptomeria japonica]|nr:hypothetical protein SUGI_0025450 [Cryptomeria japonica]